MLPSLGREVIFMRTFRLALLGLFVLTWTGLSVSETAADPRVKAPNLRTVDMNGEKVSLEDVLGKGPIVVDFWATWCKPCIKELPYIQRLHEEYSEKGLTVLAVTIDTPKFQSRVKPFIKGRKFTFPVWMDGTSTIFRKLQGKGSIPYVVVLDSEGYIRYRHTGYRPGDEKELEKVVLELFEEEVEAPEEEPSAATEESTG
jgi:thiol-disulfide isomerase/thioredoxin